MRNRILMAAADEIKTRGVKFTMSDLARRLSLSKTSLYEHFASKNALVHDILSIAIQDVQEQEQQIYNNSDLSVAEKVRALLRVSQHVFGPIHNHSIFDDLRHYYPEEWQLVSDFQQERLDHLMSLIVQGIENSSLRPVNVPVLRQVVNSAMNDLFNYRFLEESNMTHADALSAMADIIMYVLLPPNK
ncbi:AcrR family transcriptional regulator [Sporomusaceae bacterium BoRhaA]|uniref:TetR/AcrR family transcriptional regulator n=1 Tax=Pelorhabdus rhamnosifermentans TaxID=2772457 RepID=UPI001C0630B3|nr:TetR/AcrR family transcriptional regulator [Pelorhabdus rhamnosifermentans]MBU2700773.1 AcrR family transcriptional regulator [Pelorhabdus rhamnosifermentans]